MKKRIFALCLAAVLLVLGGCTPALPNSITKAPQYVFTYAENQAEDYPTTQGAYRFADLVYSRTGGRIKINVYPNAALGDEPSVLDQLRYGGIDFARVSVMSMADSIPELNVLQLPYLYEDSEQMWSLLDGEVGGQFIALLQENGYIGLSWYDAGARNFYSSGKAITRLEDLAGMKIRVAESSLMASLVRLLGATPLTITYSGVYSALERGIIDGAENNLPSYQSAGHYTVAPYVTLDAHNRIPEIQICSPGTWGQLSQKDREIVLSCAKESAEYERMLWAMKETAAREALEKAGCTITELSPEEMARFKEAAQPLYEEFAEKYPNLVQGILQNTL